MPWAISGVSYGWGLRSRPPIREIGARAREAESSRPSRRIMIPVRANHWPRVRETTCMSVCIYSYVHVYVGEYTYGRERAGPRREYKNARSGKDPRAPSTGKKAYKSMCVCVDTGLYSLGYTSVTTRSTGPDACGFVLMRTCTCSADLFFFLFWNVCVCVRRVRGKVWNWIYNSFIITADINVFFEQCYRIKNMSYVSAF